MKFERSALVVLGTVAGACGGGTSSGNFGPAMRASLCEYQVRCGLAADRASCERSMAVQTRVASIEASIASGRTRYDPGRAAACFARYAQLTCTAADLVDSVLADACAGMFDGQVPAGEPCYSEADCVGHGECAVLDTFLRSCHVGTCGPPRPPRAAGGPCAAGVDCDNDHLCNITPGQPATCVPRFADGQQCPLFGCALNSQCVGDGVSTSSGTCMPRPKDGERCQRVDECVSLLSACDDGVCRPRQKTCQPCTHVACALYLSCVAGICQPPPDLGQPCSSDPDAAPCRTGLCIDGVCTAKACELPPASHADAATD